MIKGYREYQIIPGARDKHKGQRIKLLLSFTGRNDLWGYQVHVVGKDFHAGHSQCQQINNKVSTTDYHLLVTSRGIRSSSHYRRNCRFRNRIAGVSVLLLGQV